MGKRKKTSTAGDMPVVKVLPFREQAGGSRPAMTTCPTSKDAGYSLFPLVHTLSHFLCTVKAFFPYFSILHAILTGKRAQSSRISIGQGLTKRTKADILLLLSGKNRVDEDE